MTTTLLFREQPDGTLAVTGTLGAPQTLDIPRAENGRTITAIDAFAFSELTALSEVRAHETLVRIGAWAFKDCTALARVAASGVQFVGEGAFFGCAALAEVAPLVATTTVGNFAFLGCEKLSLLSLPENCTTGENALPADCEILPLAAYVSPIDREIAERFTVREDGGIGAANTALAGEVTLPAAYAGRTLTTVVADGFARLPELAAVNVPAGYTTIETNAFSECPKLTRITLPATLSRVGIGPIAARCPELRELTVDAENPYLYARDGYLCSRADETLFCGIGRADTFGELPPMPFSVRAIAPYAFAGALCGIKVLHLPYGVERIGAQTFLGAEQLEYAEIPDSVIEIGAMAFAACPRLGTVCLPANCTVAPDAFDADCRIVRRTEETPVFCYYYSALYGGFVCDRFASPDNRDTEAVIPAEYEGIPVLAVGQGAFQNNNYLQKVTVSEGVRYLSGHAFCFCENLTEVTLPDSLIELDYGVFYGCTSLETVNGGRNLDTIGITAFARCTALAEILLPAGCRTADDTFAETTCTVRRRERRPEEYFIAYDSRALPGMRRLGGLVSGVPIPAVLTVPATHRGKPIGEIAVTAFADQPELREIRFEGHLRTIGHRAFSHCQNLTTLILPPTLRKIETLAFADCPHLREVALPAGCVVEAGAFPTGCQKTYLPAINALISVLGQIRKQQAATEN